MFGQCSGRPTGVLASPFHCAAIVVALLAGREPMPLVLARGVPAIGMRMVGSGAVSHAQSVSTILQKLSTTSTHTSGAILSVERRYARNDMLAVALHRMKE